MDHSTRTSVVAAAVVAAGPVTGYDGEDAWQHQVHANAVSIAVMASDTSQIARSIQSVENAKVFSGTVMQVRKEHSSTRGVITLHTDTDRTKDGVPEGCESVRTDRTDNPLGLAMARRVKSLVGHRVLVWVEIEEFNGGQGKVRVVKHVEALAPDAEFADKARTTGLAA